MTRPRIPERDWNLEMEEGVSESEIKKIADELITRVDEILIV